MPDKEKLITVKRLSTDIIIPFHVPQNKHSLRWSKLIVSWEKKENP